MFTIIQKGDPSDVESLFINIYLKRKEKINFYFLFICTKEK